MNEIIIYTKDWCGYCRAAIQLLQQLGKPYREIDVTTDAALYQEMLQRADGRTSVPQIFINGEGIGGYTDLYQMIRSGEFPADNSGDR